MALCCLGALLASGCNDDHGGNAGDLSVSADLADTTALPTPTAMHVGAAGPTAGLVVAAGTTAAAYLLNPSTATVPATGELHVVTQAGVDKMVDTGVAIGGYALTNDGKHIVYTKPTGGVASLFWADVSGATVTTQTLLTSTFPSPTLAQGGFLAPSGHYFLAGVKATNVANSLDLHVIDMRAGTDIYQRPNGGFDYRHLVLPDDTCLFQDTAGGQTAGSPPVQTLYWISLANVATPAAAITTRTSTFTPTADNKTIVYLKTNGDLYTWDAVAKTGAGTKVAAGVVTFTLGVGAAGPIAYIAADGSVHVQSLDGATKMLDTPASTATSFRAPLVLAPDNADVYFFDNGDPLTGGVQNNQGTLMRVAVRAGAVPTKVADKVSIRDLQVTDRALLFLQNLGVPPAPPATQFGDAAKAERDGTGLTPLGMTVPVGGLQAVNPGPDTWFAMQLTAALDDSAATKTVDGSPKVLGALSFEDASGAAITLDAKVHQGAFAFALDDGRTGAFVSGATFDATAGNYVGSLKLFAARAPSMTVDGMVAGVAELGPIVGRSLFVSAPAATMAGVYFVKY